MAEPIPVLFNPRSGDGAADAPAIAAAFARHGLPARLQALHGGDGDQRVLDAAATAPLAVAGGGDGTIATLAAALRGRGTLGVLPMGTRNHFARDAGIPLELDEAVAAIAHGATRAVDLGEVNGHVFLNNASLGVYTRFVDCREGERHRPGWALWPTLLKAAWRALRTSRDLDLELVVDGARVRRRTPALLIGNNVYALQGADRGRRKQLDAGVLSVTVLRPRSRAGLAWFGLRALVGAVSAERDFESLVTQAIVVHAHRPKLDVALDGEPRELAPPLHFRSLPGALRVRVPAVRQDA